MKKQSTICLMLIIICGLLSSSINAQKRPAKAKLGKICGNPQLKCRTGEVVFQDYEMAFEFPKGDTVIVDSEPFYAIILKIVKPNSEADCEKAVSENERLEIQKLFTENKVFALKCYELGNIYYTNVAKNVNFIAVYAGKTLTEANDFLKTVKATGKYQGANLRKMQAGINGT